MQATNIKRLKEELLLGNGPYTNEQIINAAAVFLLKRKPSLTCQGLFDALWDECDMSLAMTLATMDKEELFFYASLFI